jgi:hypothetical protein
MEIKFISKSLEAEACVEKPVQARTAIPEWFKKTPRVVDHLGTSKTCMPFFDTFTTGYIQKLWCDIEFSKNGTFAEFDSDHHPLTIQKENPKHVPIFDGHFSVELQWNTYWEPITPKGYSTLYTHPLNQYDLPFMTFSGIIDTDNFNLTGPLRFILKKGFEGIIKKGTPLYQMIPLKRDDWSNPKYEYDYDTLLNQNSQLNKYKSKNIGNAYKDLFWQKKNYK